MLSLATYELCPAIYLANLFRNRRRSPAIIAGMWEGASEVELVGDDFCPDDMVLWTRSAIPY